MLHQYIPYALMLHQYIPYALGVVSRTRRQHLHHMGFRQGGGDNSKTEVARVSFFIRNTLSQYD